MDRGPSAPRGRNLAACLVVASLASCTTGATEVLVQIDSDFTPGRAATLDVYLANGDTALPSTPTRSWSTDALDGGLVLPASFGVVPTPDGPRDGTVTLLAELHLAPGGPNQPAVTLRRRARFRFTPQRPLALPIFLPIACGTAATGCTTVSSDACTLATRCEELGMTCGNEARCVGVDTMPIPTSNDASTIPIDRGDAFTPPPPPRPIAPMSGTALTAGNVVFTYELPSSADGARIEICSTRTCDAVMRTIDADGSSSAPVAITKGLNWYRLRSRAGDALGPPGIAWSFRVLTAGPRVARHAYSFLDFDGDGFSDTAVGNPMSTEVTVYRGSATGLATTAAHTFREPTDEAFGSVVANAGDLNGDGFGDLAIAAPAAARVSIYYGSEAGLPTTPSVVLPAAGEETAASFGYDVASAGDVDGDGYADLLVGTGFVSTAFLYRGSANGVVTPAAALLRAPDLNARFGTALAGAGDANGDGYADALIGAWGAVGDHGFAYIFLGSASGLATTPWATMQGDTPDDHFGASVAPAGDIDADGYADVIISVAAIDRAAVYHGGATAIGSTPMLLAPPAGLGRFARFGVSCAPAGDFDGDGYGDILVGAQDVGRAYVFSGSATGFGAMPSHTLAANPGTDGSGFARDVGGGGDCNSDGRGDVWIGSTVGNTAWAFYGRPPASGDLYGDRYWTGPANFGYSVAR